MSEKNIVLTFLETARRRGPKTGFQYKQRGVWKNLTWEEAAARVAAIAMGLAVQGVKKGDRVALLSSTRLEWTLCDVAIMGLGAVTVPIYPSNIADQVEHIVMNSEATGIIVEDRTQIEKIATFRAKLPPSFFMILIEGKTPSAGVLSLSKLEEEGRVFPFSDFERAAGRLTAGDVATIVYTSGTTGPPKGAILKHGSLSAEVESLTGVIEFHPDQIDLIFLPLAHILARVVQCYQFKMGYIQAYAEGIDHLASNIREVRPHFMAAVPRIFEKVHAAIASQVEHGSSLKKGIFAWALATGREISRLKQAGRRVPVLLAAAGAVADFLVFRKIRARLGQRLNLFISGGAPLSPELAEFFHAVGVLILEGYGLTETTAATNLNRPGRYRFGSVGPAIPGIEEKIAPDGEIVVRGRVVFAGYYKNPEATREVLDPDGWFHTGDIGELDRDGFLKITDRKKDIIVTAGGKNIAPQNIEAMLKKHRWISQAMVHGDKRKFLSALLTLNREEIETYARDNGIPQNGKTPWSKNAKIGVLVKKAVDETNRGLASYETIKKFAILDEDFTQENGTLTPTLKVKRKLVTERYKTLLDSFYTET